MKAIYELVMSLTSTEWQSLGNYVTCFSANDKPQKKIWKLAQLIHASTDSFETYSSYSIKLYGKVNEEAIDRLARNLKYKILDCLVLTAHSCHEEKSEDRGDAITKLKKKCLQYHYLLQNKKDLDVTRHLLDEIISMAKEYEAYSELVQHLKLKNWNYNLREGEKKFDEGEKEVDKYEKINHAYASAYNRYAKLNIFYEFSGKPNENDIIAFLEKAIPEVKEKQASTDSKIILYYQKILEMDYAMLKENYLSARSISHEIIGIVKTNKSVFTRRRVGTAYDNLAMCVMLLGRFDEAVEYTRYALQFIQEGSYNYALSKQWEFYALYYNKQYKEAIDCAEAMLEVVKKKELGGFRYEKFYFLLANAYFAQGDFIKAYNALENKIEIKEDKEGWEFNWRVLNIMNNIELGYCDKAGKQTEALKKFIPNNSAKNSFSPRQKTIRKILSHAAQKGFMFSQLKEKAKDYIEQLSSHDKDYGWQILSAELIPFHVWAASKMKKGIKVSVK